MVQEWNLLEQFIFLVFEGLGYLFVVLFYMAIVAVLVTLLYLVFIFPFRFAFSRLYRQRVITRIKAEYKASNRPLGFWTTYFGGGGG